MCLIANVYGWRDTAHTRTENDIDNTTGDANEKAAFWRRHVVEHETTWTRDALYLYASSSSSSYTTQHTHSAHIQIPNNNRKYSPGLTTAHEQTIASQEKSAECLCANVWCGVGCNLSDDVVVRLFVRRTRLRRRRSGICICFSSFLSKPICQLSSLFPLKCDTSTHAQHIHKCQMSHMTVGVGGVHAARRPLMEWRKSKISSDWELWSV